MLPSSPHTKLIPHCKVSWHLFNLPFCNTTCLWRLSSCLYFSWDSMFQEGRDFLFLVDYCNPHQLVQDPAHSRCSVNYLLHWQTSNPWNNELIPAMMKGDDQKFNWRPWISKWSGPRKGSHCGTAYLGKWYNLPVLCEHIDSWRMICTVSQVHRFKMRHEVQEATSYFVLIFRKPGGKTRWNTECKIRKKQGDKGRGFQSNLATRKPFEFFCQSEKRN